MISVGHRDIKIVHLYIIQLKHTSMLIVENEDKFWQQNLSPLILNSCGPQCLLTLSALHFSLNFAILVGIICDNYTIWKDPTIYLINFELYTFLPCAASFFGWTLLPASLNSWSSIRPLSEAISSFELDWSLKINY